MSEQPVIYARKPVTLDLDPGAYWWCACGRSANQPFCDGAHKGGSFKPLKFEVPVKKLHGICQCKHTSTPPFCDGSHKSLPAD